MTAPEAETAAVCAAFGRRVRARRTARGWSLRAMAPMAGMGASALHRIESGEGTTLATAGRIAAALGLPLSVLVTACGHCHDSPDRGFTCQECGTAGPAVTA